MLVSEKRGTVHAFSRNERDAPSKPPAKGAHQNERIDYAALRKRVMGRFAKTLAHLGK